MERPAPRKVTASRPSAFLPRAERFYRRIVRPLIPPISLAVVLSLLALMYMLSDAIHNQTRFESIYLWLLIGAAAGILFLAGVVLAHIVSLVRQHRRGQPGARLTSRLIVTFIGLSAVPVGIVYYFSLTFVQRGIDSWFDVQIEHALNDALSLSRLSLEGQMRDALQDTRRASRTLRSTSSELLALELDELRRTTAASEMTVFGARNLILASSSDDERAIIPNRPDEVVLAHVRQGKDYIGLDPLGKGGLFIRVVTPVTEALHNDDPGLLGGRGMREQDARVLQALYTVNADINRLAESVQSAFNEYRELLYLHASLKQTFTLALTLALLLSLLTAVWLASIAARRMLAPIRDLAAGTRAVAEGNYDLRLPVDRADDLGQLVRSFNTMTARIARASGELRRLQELADQERDYLETVLNHLSSGVITLDPRGVINRANGAVAGMLSLPPGALIGHKLDEVCAQHPHLEPLCTGLGNAFSQPGSIPADRQEQQVRLMTETGRRLLLCRAAALPAEAADEGGFVLVIDDVTTLLQAQRDAAWSEVARRLAHEIKNPLTPIQLSAERLRRRLMDQLPEESAAILDRATHTIVQQVDAMKHMVNEFAEYARTPQMQLGPLDLNTLARDVTDLYRGGPVRIEPRLADCPVMVEADAGRLRQLLHNLLRNAQQALTENAALTEKDGAPAPLITVCTRLRQEGHIPHAELVVGDNGPGFPEALLDTLFDPYVTTRPKGTGLGLAIVKKIVEEHGGVVNAYNAEGGGARVAVRLPLLVREGHSAVASPGTQDTVPTGGDGKEDKPPAGADDMGSRETQA
ncbi:MAG: ATP-binding protein [Halothiobacillaceae bacterium]|nr:ATP-binding protein [Halothiobacillaceae bacterium]